MNEMYFNKQHLRNMIRTLRNKKYKILITEEYNDSMGNSHINKWKCCILGYQIKSEPEYAWCKLILQIQNLKLLSKGNLETIEFDIPYNCDVKYGDITKGEKYEIDYVNSGPHCYYIFQKI